LNAVAANSPPSLVVASDAVGQITMLTATGLLDATTYLSLRDSIIKAALEEPPAVVVDISELFVPRESALAVFTSARWHVERWPVVPILLVSDHRVGRDALARNGVTRYVPVYPDTESACAAVTSVELRPRRRRAHLDLPADLASLPRSRRFVVDSLSTWSMPDLIPVAKIVVTTFVENVLAHTDSRAGIRLETDGTTVTVAVEDSSHSPANVREPTEVTNAPTGLGILGAICRMWGNSPMPSGKTVWAVIGPENRL
jgi:STAS domain